MRISDWSSDVCSSDLWSVSAHAKDIWTIPAWEKREKLAEANWLVTCTAFGAAHLRALAGRAGHVHLLYHGLDLDRFGEAAPGRSRSEEHTSELQSLMRISYDVFCLKQKTAQRTRHNTNNI